MTGRACPNRRQTITEVSPLGSNPTNLVASGDTLFFTASSGTTPEELW